MRCIAVPTEAQLDTVPKSGSRRDVMNAQAELNKKIAARILQQYPRTKILDVTGRFVVAEFPDDSDLEEIARNCDCVISPDAQMDTDR